MDEITTTDLTKFGYRERKIAESLLIEWNKGELPSDFNADDVVIMMNTNSGNVFLTNSDMQVCMINGDKLESFYNCPYCGHEGFKEEMKHNPSDKECLNYLKDIDAISEEEYIKESAKFEE